MTKKPTEPKTKKKISYQAKVGCWNCDSAYEIAVKIGQITPQFLVDKEMKCRTCGCETLKMFAEYRIEKKIMKEVILHHRIEHLHDNEEPQEPNKNHNHFG